jgi:hypothetical protein
MKIIPGNSIGRQVRNEYLVHTFDKDMHRDFGSMGSGPPPTNEVNNSEDENGPFGTFLLRNRSFKK